jgi:hypothetical protein
MTSHRRRAQLSLELARAAVKLSPTQVAALASRARREGARGGCSVPIWLVLAGSVVCIALSLVQCLRATVEAVRVHCRQWVFLDRPLRPAYVIGG